MTEADYIKLCMERARVEAEEVLERCIRPFDEVKSGFVPNNITQEEFDEILEEMNLPKKLCRHKRT